MQTGQLGGEDLTRILQQVQDGEPVKDVRRLVRELIRRWPIDAEVSRDEPDPGDEVQWEWLDQQLWRAYRYRHISPIEDLGDGAKEALQSAWPDGLDEALFGAPSEVEAACEALTEEYRQQMHRYGYIAFDEHMELDTAERDELMREMWHAFLTDWREDVLSALKDRMKR